MKEWRILFFVLFILVASSLFFGIINASVDSQVGDVAKKIEGGTQNVNNFLSNSDVRSNYLKQEWLKIIQSRPFGQYVLPIHNFLTVNKQIFWYILGINYQVSWKFFLTFFFWLVLVVFCFRILSGLVMFLMLRIPNFAKRDYKRRAWNSVQKPSVKFFVNIVVFLVVIFVLSVVRISLGLAILVSGLFSSDTGFFTKVIYFVIIILVILGGDIIYKKLSFFAKIYRKISGQKIRDREVDAMKKDLNDIKSGKKTTQLQSSNSEPQEDEEDSEDEEVLAQARADLGGIAEED